MNIFTAYFSVAFTTIDICIRIAVVLQLELNEKHSVVREFVVSLLLCVYVVLHNSYASKTDEFPTIQLPRWGGTETQTQN